MPVCLFLRYSIFHLDCIRLPVPACKKALKETFSKRSEKKQKGVKIMTNGDVIRNMTDEEIADFLLSEESSACFHCEYYDHEIKRCYLDNPCVKGLAWVMLLEWLSSQTVYERSENP